MLFMFSWEMNCKKQIWEAMMYAAHNRVDNLIATIDFNGQQIDGPVDEINSLLT